MNLVVDPSHLGTPESEWMASQRLADLPRLRSLRPRRVVVVTPHPDDEIFGTAGLLVTLHQRRIPIEIIAVTDGEASHSPTKLRRDFDLRAERAGETQEALHRLGCADPTIRRLGLPDGGVRGRIDQLADLLSASLFPDDLCLAPWHHDGHPDHDACGEAALRACRSTGADHLAYLIWAWHWARPHRDDLPWIQCRQQVLPRRVAARKRWSTSAFGSQIQPIGLDGTSAVLPPPVLRRFWRPFEVFVDGTPDR